MSSTVSTLGKTLIASSNLGDGQTQLSTLSEQLATGKYSTNLTDYTSSESQKLLNLTSKVDTQNGFLDIIDTLTPRLEGYDKAMTGVEDTVSDAYTLILSSTTYNDSTNASVAGSIEGSLDDIVYYLNQKVGDRYIFAGSRYDTAPVISTDDILSQTLPPASTTPVSSPAVPAYDVDYDSADPTASNPDAYYEASSTINDTKTLTYGVSSDEDGFQQVILGLQWAYAATQDETNYTSYMDTARNLLTDGLANIRASHTSITNAYTSLNNTKDMITTNVNSLNDQVDNIEAVDVNEVGVKITSLKAQLEAAYSATGQILKLSLLDYI